MVAFQDPGGRGERRLGPRFVHDLDGGERDVPRALRVDFTEFLASARTDR
jgi:hypothetical protein